jgi:YkoY family integral membrane protein
MFNQVFDLADVPRLFTLTFIELLLSADNAIVLGLLTHSLSPKLRKKALIVGGISAFFFRAAALSSVSWLLTYFWVQILGGAYLIYLAAHHFLTRQTKKKPSSEKIRSFWQIVLLIELFDLAFAIDSIVAGLAFITPTQITGSINPKLWIVYFGGMIGLFGVRYAAHMFSQLIDRFPRLNTTAFLLIGWIGIKLCYEVLENHFSYTFPYEPIFWGGLILLLLLGFTQTKSKTA